VALLALALCAPLASVGIAALGYRPFWSVLLVVLAGYALLGKGFAYLGVPPLFVGEVALAIGVFSLLVLAVLGRWQVGAYRPPLLLATLLAFMTWQAARTAPYVPIYGLDAVRDGALWGYATFALCIAALVPRKAIDRIVAGYGKMIVPYLLWSPIALAMIRWGAPIPKVPGSPEPLLMLKAGDVGVHLGGIGAFLLIAPGGASHLARRLHGWLPWLLWWTGWFVVAATNRAGALAAMIGIGIATVWSLNARVIRFAAMAVLIVGVLALTGANVRFRGGELSVSYVATSLASIVGRDSQAESGPDLQSTKRWRLEWWQDIVSYTVGGPHFWAGKGYGVNLATDDGRGGAVTTLRSPHNATMTILARSGVPGLGLWLLFLAVLAWSLVKTIVSAGASSADRRFAVWALAYLAAFLANSSFDVYLEGPMGGIWFWTLVGVCLIRIRGSTGDVRTATAGTGSP